MSRVCACDSLVAVAAGAASYSYIFLLVQFIWFDFACAIYTYSFYDFKMFHRCVCVCVYTCCLHGNTNLRVCVHVFKYIYIQFFFLQFLLSFHPNFATSEWYVVELNWMQPSILGQLPDYNWNQRRIKLNINQIYWFDVSFKYSFCLT